jgi:hypothetical protein
MNLQNRWMIQALAVPLSLSAMALWAHAQQTPAPVIQEPPEKKAAPAVPASTNRLVTGKLIYVAPMPNNLDKWLQEDLRTWGRYRVTSNPEGVDLEISAEIPERRPQYRERHGVPLPKSQSKKRPQETSISVTDWTTGAELWSATLLDRNPKANESAPAPAATVEIPARDLTPDQLALKITRELERYVEEIEGSGGH